MRHLPWLKSRLFVAVFFCSLWTVAVCAAEKNASYQAALESIKADELYQYVDRLASEDMEGREAGTKGGLAAAEYLVEQYKQLHLNAAGDDGKFFQQFEPNMRNVLAILPGSDPQLRDQVIVVCAHFDHIGYGRFMSLGPYGYIHPGADDNASGTSAVIELAKAFTMLAPKRSILFANWDGEEKGLLGSKHWVTHPTMPLDRVTVALNLDMIGRLRDKSLMVMGSRSGFGMRRLLSVHNDVSDLQFNLLWGLHGNADHFPFTEHDIPALLFHTGVHPEYHKPTDVAKLINREGMQVVTRLAFGLIYDLADRPEPVPGFRAAARQETPETEKNILAQKAKPADRLGVGWNEDASATGGVHVSMVAPGSPSEKAGLRVDDCIVRFDGRDIRSDDDFFGAVCTADAAATMTVKRPGEEKSLDLPVKLPGSPLRWGILWRVDDAEPGVVILTHVVPGSPAAQAGLGIEDRIYQVGGRDFTDETAFALLAKTLSKPVQLLVERNGRLRTVTLQPRQAEPLKRAA
jgi:hypothetical protein